MKKTLLFVVLILFGCDQRSRKDLLFPADEYLDIPVAKHTVRLHCNPYCPPHDKILAVMHRVRDKMLPLGLKHDPWVVWSTYGITFSDTIVCLDESNRMVNQESGPCPYKQVWGMTRHGRKSVYIHLEDEYQGIRAGVLEWELTLQLVEKEIPWSTEDEKIQWLKQKGIN